MELDFFSCFRKGSANAVFRYEGKDPQLAGTVLRLRLAGQDYTTQEIYEYMHQFSSLKRWIIPTKLVELEPGAIHKLEKDGLKLKPDTHGLLMDNVFEESDCREIALNKHIILSLGARRLLELKPKWLDPGSNRTCRNCAHLLSKGEKFIVCPLQLLTTDGIHKWCKAVEHEALNRGCPYLPIEDAVQANILLFQTLASIQARYPNVHQKLMYLESEVDVDEHLCETMTMRDVTVFIDLDSSKALLCDLDRKSPRKWQKWRDREIALNKLMQ
ncbi:hypothetical protein KL941_004937 [Ogataea angusta]|nr:hypothetical protein KL941_004937 [Ogataea angusta]